MERRDVKERGLGREENKKDGNKTKKGNETMTRVIATELQSVWRNKGSVFFLTNNVCHLQPLLVWACGRSVEWVKSI